MYYRISVTKISRLGKQRPDLNYQLSLPSQLAELIAPGGTLVPGGLVFLPKDPTVSDKYF